jgi:hypothetical protein
MPVSNNVEKAISGGMKSFSTCAEPVIEIEQSMVNQAYWVLSIVMALILYITIPSRPEYNGQYHDFCDYDFVDLSMG